jgi:hypothetical protein
LKAEKVFRSTSEYFKEYFPKYYAKNVLKIKDTKSKPEKSLIEPFKSKLRK